MIKHLLTTTLCLGMAFSEFACAYEYNLRTTSDGIEYGFHQGEAGSPLLISITTDIKESMTDIYSPVGGSLAEKGYSIASVDVPCHGKDLHSNEKAGLECWSSRSAATDNNIFDNYISNIKSVIADIKKAHLTDMSDITVLGVSRGGYLALKTAAEIPEVTNIVALAPVTDVFRLREFNGSKASKPAYSLEPYYNSLASKHIFIQINNNDDRVGTQQAISLIEGVTKAGDPRAVDLTAIITPQRSHSTSEHQTAADWVIQQRTRKSDAQLSAPK